MTYPPKARVIVTPYAGPERRALVVSKVNDTEAYVIRYANGERHTVPAVQLRPNVREDEDRGLLDAAPTR